MSDIRAAAKRLVEAPSYASGNNPKPNEFVWSGNPADAIDVAQAYLAGPAWHDRPTCPGLWVCVPTKEGGIYQTLAMALTAEDLARGVPFHTKRVFGPIPEEKRDGE